MKVQRTRSHAVAVMRPARHRRRTLLGSLRYVGVLAVWAGLFMIRPELALRILRERRADSPLPRWPAPIGRLDGAKLSTRLDCAQRVLQPQGF